MAFEPLFREMPSVGRIFIPEAVISYPGGGKCQPKYTGIVAVAQHRPRGVVNGQIPDRFDEVMDEIDPLLLEPELIHASVSHNQRTIYGSRWQMQRMFGFGSLTPTPAGAVYVGLGSSTSDFANASGHLGINTNVQSVGSEIVAGNMTRIAGGNSASTNATALDATFAVLISASWSANTSVTVVGCGLFDTVSTGASSANMYAEATVATATVIPNDTVTLTWTVNN